tara:strand:- start:36 stop:449 length:414 start_codon:yes stop_codon:yes gene_type:complete
MKNLTTEELAKTYYQAVVKASEAGNHKEVLSLVCEVGNQSHLALASAHNAQDENGERAFAQALLAAAEATRPSEEERMRDENERNDAKRRLHSLGYNEYLCRDYGLTYWSQTENGLRTSYESDPRKVLESLKNTEEN